MLTSTDRIERKIVLTGWDEQIQNIEKHVATD
jgi:hypothetical protein